MDWKKPFKIFFNVVYFFGVAIVLCLVSIYFFGSNEVMNPEAMLPRTWQEQAFVFLALGTVPMLLACIAAYNVNVVKNSLHKKRKFILIFLPGLICLACSLFLIGLLVIGMIN